jgi:DNA-binding MarR family transcriptional regulator
MNRQNMMYDIEKLFRNFFRTFKHDLNDILGDEMTSNEFIILKMISELGPLKVSTISKELNVSASHITVVTDKLLARHYIERKRDDNDRRIVLVTVTKLGKELINKLQVKKIDYMLDKFSPLKDEELMDLKRLFQKIDV